MGKKTKKVVDDESEEVEVISSISNGYIIIS